MSESSPADLARIAKLEKINNALMQRLLRMGEVRGLDWAQSRTTAVLERELVRRNQELEDALGHLAKTNTELERANGAADEANRAKSRFLRAASHDLLQPLSAAKLFLAHLRQTNPEGPQHNILATITATLDSAEELIHALADIARLDSRMFEAKPAPVVLDRLLRRVATDTASMAAHRALRLRIVPSSLVVESDPILLRQIVQNLVTNALKYTTGSKVVVGLRRAGRAVWLEVHDAGPGIAPEDQPRIFTEFERLSRSDQPGTGLGLSIVQRACAQLGHPLELQSQLGRGSCFRVALPVLSGDEAQFAQGFGATACNPHTLPDYKGLRLFVIENDPAMRAAFTLLFESWGFDIHSFAEGARARHAAHLSPPALVLSDYRLDHGETAVTVLRALAEDLGRTLPALIVSAEDAAQIRAEAGKLAVEVLSKPLNEVVLRRAFDRVLAVARRETGPSADRPASLAPRFRTQNHRLSLGHGSEH